MSRELDVFLEDTPAGRLHENAGIWSFGYDAAWLETGFPLAPGLPLQEGLLLDTGSKRPVQWFFDNLLPEEAARTRLIASVADDAAAPVWDAWRLLERFGGESAGVLSLMPPGQAAAPGLVPLSDERLEARILAIPHAQLAAEAPKKCRLPARRKSFPWWSTPSAGCSNRSAPRSRRTFSSPMRRARIFRRARSTNGSARGWRKRSAWTCPP